MIKLNAKEKTRILKILNALMDICEDCYPKYYSSDVIMEADDFIKELDGGN